MVAESTGAWAAGATRVLLLMAAACSRTTGRDKDEIFREVLQAASVEVRTATARATLRRLHGDEAAGSSTAAAQAILSGRAD